MYTIAAYKIILTSCNNTASVRVPFVSRKTVASRVVVDDTALGVSATEADTRIFAFLVDACQGRGAFGVGDTLWTTFDGRVSVVASQAGAHGCVVCLSALGVPATWRWHAGVRVLWLKWRRRRLWHRSTVGEWISGVTLWAVAHDDVVRHVTFCSRAALTGTRVLALVVVAVLVPRAITVQYAFRLATTVRVSVVLVAAYANADAVLIIAIGIRSTGRWIAGVSHCWCSRPGSF